MSDHLASLAARAVGRPAVRPLVPTMFGHLAAHADDALEVREELDVAALPESARAAGPPTSRERTDAPRLHERVEAQPHAAAAPTGRIAEAPRAADASEMRPSATPRDLHRLLESAEPARAAPLILERMVVMLPAAAPPVERRLPTRELVHAAAAVPPERSVPPASAAAVAAAVPRTLPAPTPPPANTPRERREPLPAPAVIPVLARRELAVPQAPDVHITIGRVDVRAVPAPAPRPAAPPSRRQPLALDAYLSQRQGGRP